MTDKRRLGTKKDYADLRGWNKAYLSKADVKERLAGAMVIDTADGKKKLDFDKADKIFEETADPARKKPNTKKNTAASTAAAETAPADTPDPAAVEQAGYHSVRTERERLKLREEQAAYQKSIGNTLAKDQVTNALLKATRILQEKLKSRNRRMAEKVKTITDHLVILSMLNASDREILEDLSNGIIEQLELARHDPGPTD